MDEHEARDGITSSDLLMQVHGQAATLLHVAANHGGAPMKRITMAKLLWILALAAAPALAGATPVTIAGSAIVSRSFELGYDGTAYQYVTRPADLGQRLDFGFSFDASVGMQERTAQSARTLSTSGCINVLNGSCTDPTAAQAAVVLSTSLAGKPMLPTRISSLDPLHKTMVQKYKSPILEYFDLLFDHYQTVTTGDRSSGDYLEQFVETGLVLSIEGEDVFADIDLGETPDFEALPGSARLELQYLQVETSCLYIAGRCSSRSVTGEMLYLTVDRIAQISEVPEPGTLATLGIGLAGLATARRRQTVAFARAGAAR